MPASVGTMFPAASSRAASTMSMLCWLATPLKRVVQLVDRVRVPEKGGVPTRGISRKVREELGHIYGRLAQLPRVVGAGVQAVVLAHESGLIQPGEA
jgi:hypothetical protein